MFFTDALTGYDVGDSGIILKTTNGGGVGINDISHSPALLKIYPTPSSGSITIRSSGMNQEGLLSILNIESQEVLTRQINQAKTQLDISGLPGGVYFVRLTNDITVKLGKFVKE